MRRGIPSISHDLCSRDALADPYPIYAAIRAAGPVVHLEAHDVLAVGRHDDARTEILTGGCAYGSISMTSWVVDG